jgi:hypothetical protein
LNKQKLGDYEKEFETVKDIDEEWEQDEVTEDR